MCKIIVSKRTLFILFLIFPMIKFDVNATNYYFGYFFSESIDNLLVLWDFFSIIIIFILFVNNVVKKGFKFIESYVLLSLALSIILFYSTRVLSNMSIYRIFRELGNTIAFLMLANLCHREIITDFLQAFYYNITFLMTINALSMYLLPPWYTNETGSVYYLFGLDNATFLIVLCGFCAGFIYHLTKYNKLHLLYLLIYAFISSAYFYTASATGMIISLLCVAFIFTYQNKIYKILSYKLTLLFSALIFFLLVVNTSFVNYFGGLLTFLGKGTNFNGREHLWQIAFEQWKQNKWLGYGVATETISKMFINGGLSWGAAHMHNLILEYLIKGGCVGLLLFCLMWIVKVNKSKKIEQNIISTSLYGMILIAFLMYMFDYRLVDVSFWIYLVLISELETLQKVYKRNNLYKMVSYWK